LACSTLFSANASMSAGISKPAFPSFGMTFLLHVLGHRSGSLTGI
jgi:hypothetical protein